MNLDHDELHRLLAILADSDIQEFRLEGKDFRLDVKRNIPGSPQASLSNNPSLQNASSVSQPQPQLSLDPPLTDSSTAPANPPSAPPSARPDSIEIKAPMVGTFYRAPAPGEPVFVEVGAQVNTGQTGCIIEAMKLMNELESEVSGEILEILVENGTPVEFGQVLMRVKKS